MSTPFQCDDKDTLIAYLYGEIDDETRRQVKAHVRTCAACADEIEGLQAVRRDLLDWQPPEMPLNFAIVQKPATEGRLAMKCAIQAVKTGKGCGGIDVLRGLPDEGTVTQANASKFTAEWPG